MSDENHQTQNNNNRPFSTKTFNRKQHVNQQVNNDRIKTNAPVTQVNESQDRLLWLPFLFIVLAVFLVWSQPEADPDLFVKTPQLIESRGFLCQEHFIQTSDGYIIAVHRIVNPLVKTKGRPVLLWHGLGATGRDFLINDGKGFINESLDVVGNNIGFELAKRGYDVWLANSRGNVYSRNHTDLDPEKDKEFWNYSYDEIIEHDVPKTIDYILEKTGKKSLGYVGHSQGTMVMFGLLATQAKYNEMVKPFIAMAPVATLDKVTPFINVLVQTSLPEWYFNRVGPMNPKNKLDKTIRYLTCSSFARYLCMLVNGFFEGYDYAQFNMSRYHVYISGYPAGFSTKNMLHMVQNVKSGVFTKFHYGHEGNIAKYASSLPPEYFLQNITNKHIALFSSLNDPWATQGNINNLRSKLKVKVMDDYIVPFKDWNHLDFVVALEAGKYINSRILDLLRKFDTEY